MTTSLFRVDTFEVPAAALPAFLERVHLSDRLLAELPGCLQHRVLTRAGDGPGYDVVTIVEWANAAAMAAAKTAVQHRYAEEGFDPPAFMRGLGVKASMGSYADVL